MEQPIQLNIQKIQLSHFLSNRIKKDKNIPKILSKILDARMDNDKVWIDYSEVRESLGFSENSKLNQALCKFDILKEMELALQSEAQFLKSDSKKQVISIEFEMFKKLALNRNTTQSSDQIKYNVKNIKHYLSLMDTLAIKYTVYEKMFIQCKNNRAKSTCNDTLMNDLDQWPQQVQIDNESEEEEETKDQKLNSLEEHEIQSEAGVSQNTTAIVKHIQQIEPKDDIRQLYSDLEHIQKEAYKKIQPVKMKYVKQSFASALKDGKYQETFKNAHILKPVYHKVVELCKYSLDQNYKYYPDGSSQYLAVKLVQITENSTAEDKAKAIGIYQKQDFDESTKPKKSDSKQQIYQIQKMERLALTIQITPGWLLQLKQGTSKQIKEKIQKRYDKDGYVIIFVFPSKNDTEAFLKKEAIDKNQAGQVKKQGSTEYLYSTLDDFINMAMKYANLTFQSAQTINNNNQITIYNQPIEKNDKNTEYLIEQEKTKQIQIQKQEETKQKQEETNQKLIDLLQNGKIDLETFKKMFRI